MALEISLIVAMDEAGCIGRGGELPWHLPADLRRFKRITMGHTIVMGRRTYESIGRPLPGRRNVVITRQRDYHAPGVEACHELDTVMSEVHSEADKLFVIGGASLYALALPRASVLYLTRVHTRVSDGDTYCQLGDMAGWQLESEQHHPASQEGLPAFTHQTYQRSLST